ncbi:MAG: response regulator transcription factor [Bdellovibrionota bacterium]
MANILLIEDSTDIQKTIKAILNTHTLFSASTLKEAERQLSEHDYDLVLLDLSLPDGNGMEFLSHIKRTSDITVPFIIMTASSAVTDKVLGFSLGVEDYITKPFDPLELRARVEARLSRRAENRTKQNRFTAGDLQFDLITQFVTVSDSDQKKLDLTPFEFKLLLCFARHRNHVLSREQLLELVWTSSLHVSDRVIDTHVSHLRKKLSESECSIEPVYGAGYRFIVK